VSRQFMILWMNRMP